MILRIAIAFCLAWLCTWIGAGQISAQPFVERIYYNKTDWNINSGVTLSDGTAVLCGSDGAVIAIDSLGTVMWAGALFPIAGMNGRYYYGSTITSLTSYDTSYLDLMTVSDSLQGCHGNLTLGIVTPIDARDTSIQYAGSPIVAKALSHTLQTKVLSITGQQVCTTEKKEENGISAMQPPSISIYPNPLSKRKGSNLMMQVGGLEKEYNIILSDLSGRELYRTSIATAGPLQLPTHGLASSTYIVQLLEIGSVHVIETVKVIIE